MKYKLILRIGEEQTRNLSVVSSYQTSLSLLSIRLNLFEERETLTLFMHSYSDFPQFAALSNSVTLGPEQLELTVQMWLLRPGPSAGLMVRSKYQRRGFG